MQRLNTDRLLEMLESAEPGTCACDVLQSFKDEYDQQVAEQTAAAKQAAIESPMKWGVRRVQVRDTGNGQVIDTIETASLEYRDMAPFCKHVGCSLEDLQAVLDGHKRSVIGKHGQQWMSWVPQWSSSRPFDVNANARKELQEQLAREDERTMVIVGGLNEQRKQAGQALKSVPAHDTWRN